MSCKTQHPKYIRADSKSIVRNELSELQYHSVDDHVMNDDGWDFSCDYDQYWDDKQIDSSIDYVDDYLDDADMYTWDKLDYDYGHDSDYY